MCREPAKQGGALLTPFRRDDGADRPFTLRRLGRAPPRDETAGATRAGRAVIEGPSGLAAGDASQAAAPCRAVLGPTARPAGCAAHCRSLFRLHGGAAGLDPVGSKLVFLCVWTTRESACKGGAQSAEAQRNMRG